MPRRPWSLLPTCLALVLLASCGEDSAPVVSADAQKLYADQKYYPFIDGTFWRYRVDTTGESGVTVRDVARRYVRISGTKIVDTLVYTVQSTETTEGIRTTFDTLYLRRTSTGVYASSPMLRNFSLPAPLPDIGFPKEVLLIPDPLESTPSWSIVNFEYNQIPFIPIHFRISGAYLGLETVQTDFMLFKQCARIRIDLDVRLPNLEDPTDILHPTIIRETASFWFARPLGLVAADGSEIVFTLFAGRIPLNLPQRRVHQEVLGFDIIQPKTPCGTP